MSLASKPRSTVATSGYFPPIAFASIIIAFCIIGLTFLAIQKDIPGNKPRKGALFGIALGGMYLVGMIEAYVVYPVPLLGEIYTGMVDGIAILVMGFLLGRYLATDAPAEQRQLQGTYATALSILIFYVLMRYFLYAAIGVESSYSTRPVATFLWTAGMGCWIAVMYILIGRHGGIQSNIGKAFLFGALVFGLNWIAFNLFVLLFIKVPLSDLLYRSALDAVAVIVGVYVPSVFRRRLTFE